MNGDKNHCGSVHGAATETLTVNLAARSKRPRKQHCLSSLISRSSDLFRMLGMQRGWVDLNSAVL